MFFANYFKEWQWLTLTPSDGNPSQSDPTDFLNRLSTLNTRFMPTSKGGMGFFLNAQGKIISSFWLWKYQNNEYGFEIHGSSSNFEKYVDQVTFSEKILLTPLSASSSFICLSLFSTEETNSQPRFFKSEYETWNDEKHSVRLCSHDKNELGWYWTQVWGLKQDVDAFLEDIRTHLPFENISPQEFEEKFHLQRIKNIFPLGNEEVNLDCNPIELGFVNYLSQNKGCYPGQEVIERILSAGSPARKLCLLELESHSLANYSELLNVYNLASPPIEIGTVKSYLKRENSSTKTQLLALIKKIHAQPNMNIRVGAANTAGSNNENSLVTGKILSIRE